MNRLLASTRSAPFVSTMLLAFLLAVASAGFAQDADTDADSSDGQEEQAADDNTDLDEGSYADEEDDDFVPSEDIPTDQSIAFPTDI